MSTTSNENNSDSEIKNVINDNSKPKFSFSTDYHVDLLHNSLKMIDREERTKYNRKDDNETNNSNTKSHKTTKSKTSITENMDEYLTNEGHKLSETENNKNLYGQNGGNTQFIPNSTLNIFGQNEKVPTVPNNYNPLPNFGGTIQQKQEPQKQEPQQEKPQI